jgi:hypothetical protein
MAAAELTLDLVVAEAVAQSDRNIIEHHFEGVNKCGEIFFIDA